MKKIAITQRLIVNNNYLEIRECLDINYPKLLKKCDLLPIVLPLEVNFHDYFKEISIDGVVITGGNDLYSCNPNQLSEQRDNFEKKLLKYCIQNNIPVFGICRGMQLIAEYFGSSLKKISVEVNTRHSLVINENSKYFHSLQKIKEVNSYHNFYIDNLGKDLLYSARHQNNGIIKAIEHKEYKIFGQMWHSEREEPFSIHELNLIKEFFK